MAWLLGHISLIWNTPKLLHKIQIVLEVFCLAVYCKKFGGFCYQIGNGLWFKYNRVDIAENFGGWYQNGNNFWFDYCRTDIAENIGGFCYQIGTRLWLNFNRVNTKENFGSCYQNGNNLWFDYYRTVNAENIGGFVPKLVPDYDLTTTELILQKILGDVVSNW